MRGNILILGLGMQGKATLYDLVNTADFSQIIVADAKPQRLKALDVFNDSRISGVHLDVSDEKRVIDLINAADVVIEALPAKFVLPVAKLAARLGAHLVSSMYYQNPAVIDPGEVAILKKDLADIDTLAKKSGVVILSEFGMDPGLDLIMGKQCLGEVDEVIEYYSYGAGFPELAACNNPINYKFTWSVLGVMQSYLRPAKIIHRGQIVEIDGKDIFHPQNMQILDIKEIEGELESFFNGNAVYYAEKLGIRDTVQDIARFICRRPGHRAFWETLVKCGFLSSNHLKVGDARILPIEFITALFQSQDQCFYADNERDIVFIRSDVRGISQGKKKRVIYQLIDYRDLETGFTAMQRTVGFTLSIGAQIILNSKIDRRGLLYPFDIPFALVRPELEKRKICVSREELDW